MPSPAKSSIEELLAGGRLERGEDFVHQHGLVIKMG
jgi:hypothetical protein